MVPAVYDNSYVIDSSLDCIFCKILLFQETIFSQWLAIKNLLDSKWWQRIFTVNEYSFMLAPFVLRLFSRLALDMEWIDDETCIGPLRQFLWLLACLLWLTSNLWSIFYDFYRTCSSRKEKPSGVSGPCSNALPAKLQIKKQTALTNPISAWSECLWLGLFLKIFYI